MNFKKIIHSNVGKIIISVLLGIGLSCLFHKVCKDKECIKFNGPIIKDVDDKIFQYDDKCYTYKLKSTTCDTNKQIVDFEQQRNKTNGF
jgi:hypothetical protein